MKLLKWLPILILALLLSACGGAAAPASEGEENKAEEAAAPATEAEAKEAASDSGGTAEGNLAAELSVYNWADYIDEALLTKYEEEYGVKIIYDTFASNEDLLAKLQAGATGYDVIFPSDYMVAQMIELGMLAEIDHNHIPNLKNIDPFFNKCALRSGQ